jgi:pyruvate kinase
LEAVLRVVHLLEGVDWQPGNDAAVLTKDAGEVLLTAHTDALFGPPPEDRQVRIMVTIPGEAATDYLLVRELVAAGMDCMRINCAHDDLQAWERMTDHVGRANRDLQRSCRISMDIAARS